MQQFRVIVENNIIREVKENKNNNCSSDQRDQINSKTKELQTKKRNKRTANKEEE